MRTLLVSLVLLAAACGAKQSPQSPSSSPAQAEDPDGEVADEMPDEQRPDDPDDALPDSMLDAADD